MHYKTHRQSIASQYQVLIGFEIKALTFEVAQVLLH